MSHNLLQYQPLNKWGESEAKIKIEELYSSVLSMADRTIGWYHSYRSKKGNWAKGIRVTAIIFFIASTLIPYLASLNDHETSLLYVGYIFAGIGGGLLLFDKYYGLSNSWIRFVLTGMDLENMRNVFIENWQIIYINNLPITKENFAKLIDVIIKFQDSFYTVVKAETTTWAKEFEQNLAELIKVLKTQGDQLKADIEQRKNYDEAKQSNINPLTIENVPIDIIREAIDKNYDTWKTTHNLVAVSSGKKITKGEQTDINCLVFVPTQKLDSGAKQFTSIPKIIAFDSSNGITYNIPTDVRAAGSEIRASVEPALICDNTVPKRPGCSISRHNNNNTGTLGLKVFKNGQPYLLSCYHVLCAPELESGTLIFSTSSSIGSTSIVSPSAEDSNAGMKLGNVMEGELNDKLDCAIARIDDTLDVSAKLCSFNNPPASPLTITDDHARARYPIKSIGRTSGISEGTIQLAYTHCDILYNIGGEEKLKTLKGIICTDQLCNGGDSGAPVVDKDNNIIGIIIACSRQLTYIVPIQRILSKFSITLN